VTISPPRLISTPQPNVIATKRASAVRSAGGHSCLHGRTGDLGNDLALLWFVDHDR
jgi:hypothetical protein